MRASQLTTGQFCEPLAGERVEGTTETQRTQRLIASIVS